MEKSSRTGLPAACTFMCDEECFDCVGQSIYPLNHHAR